MTFVEAGDLLVRYDLEGRADAPMVVLAHSLGTDASLWDPQMPALLTRFRVLRYDIRGHGGTSVPAGPYTVAQLGADVVLLLDALGIARAHYCGLSVGGLIGMWLGAHAPERIERLVLCNTAARIGTADKWNERIATVRERGMPGISAGQAERWFTPGFRQKSPQVVARAQALLERTSPEGYASTCAAIRDADERADLAAIRAPTLVVSGKEDSATPPADGRFLAGAIPGARFVELPASHLSNLEAAEAFTSELMAFLTGPDRS